MNKKEIFATAISATLLASSFASSAFASSDTTVPQTLTAWSDQSDNQEAIYVDMPDDVCSISINRDIVTFVLCDDNQDAWDTSQVQSSSATPQSVTTPQPVATPKPKAATPKQTSTPNPTKPKNCEPIKVSGYTNFHG